MMDSKVKPSGKMFNKVGNAYSLNLPRIKTHLFGRGPNTTKAIRDALRDQGVVFKTGSAAANKLKTWALGSNQWK